MSISLMVGVIYEKSLFKGNFEDIYQFEIFHPKKLLNLG